MFDEHAFELEGGESVVAGLEHIVGAADIGDEAVLVAGGYVSRVVDAAFEGFCGLLRVAPISGGQADGTGIEAQADLTLVAFLTGRWIDEHDVESGQSLAHRTVFEFLIGRVADLQGRLGLAEAIADEHTPVAVHAVDDLGVERLTGTEGLRRRSLQVLQIGLDEHAPHGRRSAEARHSHPVHGLHEGVRVEARVVVEEDAGLGDPRGEDIRPGVLGPPGRGDVEVDVAGCQTHPVHRREVTDGIGDMGVGDHLRLRGGARSEVEQHQVIGARTALRVEFGALVIGVGVAVVLLASGFPADDDADDFDIDIIELRGILGAGDDELGVTALGTVGEVDRAQLRGGGHEHGTELDAGEHRLPQLDLVVEHDHDMVAALDPGPAEMIRHLVRTRGELREAPLALGTILFDDPQCRLVVVLGDLVEPVEGEVEVCETRPFELFARSIIVAAELDQLVSGRAELLGHCHCGLLTYRRRHIL